MMHIRIVRKFVVTNCADIDAHTDAVMSSLLKLEAASTDLCDADMWGTMSTGEVSISIVASRDDFDAAFSAGDAAIRAAIHAAGGATPQWETISSEATRAEPVAA